MNIEETIDRIEDFYDSRWSVRSEMPSSKTLERTVSVELAQILGGLTEIKIPTGHIDVLSDDWIVETKKSQNWKHAIGQLMCYTHYMDRPYRAIALIGKIHKETAGICEHLGIHLFYYDLGALRWYLEL